MLRKVISLIKGTKNNLKDIRKTRWILGEYNHETLMIFQQASDMIFLGCMNFLGEFALAEG